MRLFYGRALGYDWVWDDISAIRDNPLLRGPWTEGLFATQHDNINPALRKLRGVQIAHDSYRPLLYSSYWADIELFGARAAVLHAHNVILGLISVLALFAVARRWLNSERAGLAAAGLFALHPMTVEPVVYISGRGDILAGLQALVAVWCALLFVDQKPPAETGRGRRWGWLVLAGLAFLGSLLSKEAYIGLPLALAGLAWSRGGLRPVGIAIAVLMAVLAAFLVLRLSVTYTGGTTAGLAAVQLLPGLWLQYMETALLPYDLSTGRVFDSAYITAGWGALVALGGLAWLAWKRRTQWPELGIVVAGLGWMLVLIGPSAIVVHLLKEAPDRYAYLPLAGLSIALVALVQLFWRWQAITQRTWMRLPVGVVAAAWCISLGFVSWLQVPTWENNQTLYHHAVLMAPESSMAHYRLGVLYASSGDCATGLPLFERAVALDHGNARALNNLAVCALRLGDYQRAAAGFEDVLTITDNGHFGAWYNLGVARIQLAQVQGGCDALASALAINPTYASALSLYEKACRVGP